MKPTGMNRVPKLQACGLGPCIKDRHTALWAYRFAQPMAFLYSQVSYLQPIISPSLAFCLEDSIIYIYDCFYMTIPT